MSQVSKNIFRILKEHGHDVSLEQIPLALDDFTEHLSENYFIYYGTWLSELINNIRWAIQIYIEPTFTNSYVVEKREYFCYKYEYPHEIQNEISKQWFWRLMNNIRTKPYLKKFIGCASLKNESSLEWIDDN